jgi:hypothetical protein
MHYFAKAYSHIFLPGDYRPGCIVSVPTMTDAGVVQHKGILGDRTGSDGLPTVIHASKFFERRVVETSMRLYLWKSVGPVSSDGYPGVFPPDRVLARARAEIGKPWRLVVSNCEHFVHHAHGLSPASPQLREAVHNTAKTVGVMGALVGAVVVAKRFLVL